MSQSPVLTEIALSVESGHITRASTTQNCFTTMGTFASTLNQPWLVTSLGTILLLALPTIDKLAISAPWAAVRIMSLLSYAINFVATAHPGRLDVEISADGQVASPREGKTLLAPAFWAFFIWLPIFLGELIIVIAQFFIPEASPLVDMQKKIAGPFIAAQLFQSLWCAAFRPKYSKHNRMYVSATFLLATAYSMSRAHAIFVAQPRAYSNMHYIIFLLPLTIHFGWTTAAFLVNLNGAFVIRSNSVPRNNVLMGHASVISATVISVFINIQRSAPVYGLVTCWALISVAESMKQRRTRILEGTIKTYGNENLKMSLRGANTQLYLCWAGTFVCVSASIFSAL